MTDDPDFDMSDEERATARTSRIMQRLATVAIAVYFALIVWAIMAIFLPSVID